MRAARGRRMTKHMPLPSTRARLRRVEEIDALAMPLPARAGYRASQRSAPVALGGSLALVAATVAALATLNITRPPAPASALKVVELAHLDVTPPPPPPPAPAVEQPAAAAPQVVAPAPVVQAPHPAPAIATTPVALPPPPPVTVAAPAAPSPAPPAPAPAPPAETTVEGGDLSSKMLSAQPPSYPLESRQRREQGTVVLAVTLGTDGRVDTLSVATSSGHFRLDRAALAAVRRWRWSPTVRDGTAMMVRGLVTIPFVLRG
jgi:protein TonB